VLASLINNAIKFTKEGSIEFGILTNTDYMEFSIKDTGIGIPEAKRKTIFEKFMQADVSKIRQFEGTGLGLSIAKAYVEMLGGEIWVESEERKGSTFNFTIPYNSELKGEKTF
jgi:signal transduction histidine kinase